IRTRADPVPETANEEPGKPGSVHTGSAARHYSTDAVDCHGRGCWHSSLSLDQGPGEAGGSTRRQVSAGRYSDQQLSELRAALNLRPDPVQQHVAPPAYPRQLQIRQFLPQLHRYPRGSTDTGRLAMV